MMRKFLTLLLSALLTACASDAERLAGWEQHNRAAGRILLIYEVRTMQPEVGVGFSNTGDKPITGMSLRLLNYLGDMQVPYRDDRTYDLSAALPVGGIPPGARFNTTWDSGIGLMGCVRVAGLRLTLADGSVVEVGEKEMIPYLAPPVNGQCKNGSYYILPDSYRQMH